MPTLTTRLDLASGTTLNLSKMWFADDPYPVGLIIERPEVAEQIGEDGPIERTPANYEVWLLPEPLRFALFEFYFRAYAFFRGFTTKKPSKDAVKLEVDKLQNLVCRRIPALASPVAFTEDVVDIHDALVIIDEYFSDKIEVPEEEPAPLLEAGPRQLGPAANGPASARAE